LILINTCFSLVRLLPVCGEGDVLLLYHSGDHDLIYLFANMLLTEQIDALLEGLLYPFPPICFRKWTKSLGSNWYLYWKQISP